MAAYDVRASEVISLCNNLNIDVPKQISVLGVDNDEILCNISTPTLSSIMPNLQHNGYLAAQALDRLFEAKQRQPFSRVVCSTFQVAGADTIANAILKARLAEVAKRLRASETPISHIANQCSFNNLQHLANAFKRQYGQSMTDYRRASKTIALPL